MEKAPIIIFAYNRPRHLQKTLHSLQSNNLSKKSSLIVFADGPKIGTSTDDLKKIEEVSRIVKSKQWCGEVILNRASSNKGLSRSIIEGVTSVLDKYDRAIVLEDDLLLSRNFLDYMNYSLDRYENDERVMQISGFSFPLDFYEKKYGSYFVSMISSWGWGTWKRGWKYFDKGATGYEELKKNQELEYRFNINGSYRYSDMLYKQMETSEIDSWAIRWWWSVFRNGGLTLFPEKSLVRNIGFDSEGTHTKSGDEFNLGKFEMDAFVKSYPMAIEESTWHLSQVANYLSTKAYGKNNFKSSNLVKLKIYLQHVIPPWFLNILKRIKRKI